MLIVKVKSDNKLEHALKEYKNKVRKTKQIEKLRDGKYFEKPSVKKRNQKRKAVYIQKKNESENN